MTSLSDPISSLETRGKLGGENAAPEVFHAVGLTFQDLWNIVL